MEKLNEQNEIKKSYFAVIPADVRYDKKLIPNAKLLYGEITALCNEKGYCWAGDKYFAELYGVSKTTIQNWVKSLVDRKYIYKKIIYKDGTKEILYRYIKILAYPTQENLHTPTQENLRDNNTLFNNTFNNNMSSNPSEKIPYKTIIDYLNKRAGKKFSIVEPHKKLIKARWNEGYRLEDFKKVIDFKVAEWKGKTFQNGEPGDKYLRPSTLFSNHFDTYLNEIPNVQQVTNKKIETSRNIHDMLKNGEVY